MEKVLNKIIENNINLTKEGKVADYIPALKKANPNNIGICIVDLEGNTYKSGDCNVKFTIQSISKVITLMLAVMDNGNPMYLKELAMKEQMNLLIPYIN